MAPVTLLLWMFKRITIHLAGTSQQEPGPNPLS